jgi:hypothetical protein
MISAYVLLAVWVGLDAQKRNIIVAGWGILTLFTGLIGLALYLIFSKKSIKESINLEGKVINYEDPATGTGNIVIMIEDKEKNQHYCFFTKKGYIPSINDLVAILGTQVKDLKIRIEYIYDQTKSYESYHVFMIPKWFIPLFVTIFFYLLIGLISSMVIMITMYGNGDYYNASNALGLLFLYLVPLIHVLPIIFIFRITRKENKKTLLKIENLKTQSNFIPPIIEGTTELNYEKCPNCKNFLDISLNYCPFCGEKL